VRHFFYFFAAFAATFAAVGIFRRWATGRKILDVPNDRSSHRKPTPRGGGLPIVLVSLSIYAVYTLYAAKDFQAGYFFGALIIAFVSWLDDLYSVSFKWRFLLHAAAALTAVGGVGYFEEISLPFFFGHFDLGAAAGILLTAGWIVWLTNAYNFMDGIDGIAAIQSVAAGFGWFLLGRQMQAETVEFFGGALAFSSLGFLIHNWQPAKIFMGDVGSAFLGYSFAVMPLLLLAMSARQENASSGGGNSGRALFFGVVLVWLFLFDTIITLARRLVKGEKIWEAHRTHLYQQLATGGCSHRAIAAFYGAAACLNAILLALATVSATAARPSANGIYGILCFFLAFEAIALTVFAKFPKLFAANKQND